MRNTKKYEWDLEELEPYDSANDCQDIIDHNHADKLKELLPIKNDFKHSDLALVLDIGNDEDGLEDRYWAYVVNNRLPSHFDNSDYKVPQRFHKELKRIWNSK